MNRVPVIVRWFLPVLLLVQAQAAEPVPAAAFAARAKQTKERIEILFRHRNDAPTPPSPNQNPFRNAADNTTPTTSVSDGQPAEIAPPSLPSSDDVLLRQAVATLKISGTVVVTGGQINVSINQQTYKEGEMIITRLQGTPVYLRIRRITVSSVTFAYNNSELIQPF